MKKLLFMFCILLVCLCPALADDYLDSLGEQRDFVKTSLKIATASQKVSNAVIEDKIREGYSIFQNSLAAITIKDTVTSVKYQVEYSLDSLIIRVDLVYWQDTALFKVLRLINPDSLISQYYEGFTLLGKIGVEGIPSYYSWSQGKINFWPPFSEASKSVYIIGRGRIDNIISDTTFVADFPVNYRSIPVTYAIWQIAVITKEWEYAAAYQASLQMQLQLIGLNIDMFKESPNQ